MKKLQNKVKKYLLKRI